MDLIRRTKITTAILMMKNGGRRPGKIQEPSCLAERMVEIVPVFSLGKDKEIRQCGFSDACWKRRTKMRLAASQEIGKMY